VVVNYMREYQLGIGIPRDQVYNQTMYILVGMLAIGLVCNLLIRPVADKWFMSDAELAEERRLAHERAAAADAGSGAGSSEGSGSATTSAATVVLAWAAVCLPLAWGVYMTLKAVSKFFH
jgi:hypothetical protein